MSKKFFIIYKLYLSDQLILKFTIQYLSNYNPSVLKKYFKGHHL